MTDLTVMCAIAGEWEASPVVRSH